MEQVMGFLTFPKMYRWASSKLEAHGLKVLEMEGDKEYTCRMRAASVFKFAELLNKVLGYSNYKDVSCDTLVFAVTMLAYEIVFKVGMKLTK